MVCVRKGKEGPFSSIEVRGDLGLDHQVRRFSMKATQKAG